MWLTGLPRLIDAPHFVSVTQRISYDTSQPQARFPMRTTVLPCVHHTGSRASQRAFPTAEQTLHDDPLADIG